MNPLITLTTDFGARDPYAAAMKGVILGICPRANVVDLTHEIAPQDIMECALFLAGAMPYWPAGSIHVAVVDPGVGTERRALAIKAGSLILMCPDNGIATLVLRTLQFEEARAIENPSVMRPDASATFHGRDIFAPAAAHLANGMPFHDLGCRAQNLIQLPVPEVEVNGERIVGEILHADRFGNLITNIHQSSLPQAVREIRAGGERVAGPCRTYAEAAAGVPAAIIGGSGYLEIAVNGASAREALRLSRGDVVIVFKR